MISDLKFKIKRLDAGSDQFGLCEVCWKKADTSYLIVFWEIDGNADDVSIISQATRFGHKECLESYAEFRKSL